MAHNIVSYTVVMSLSFLNLHKTHKLCKRKEKKRIETMAPTHTYIQKEDEIEEQKFKIAKRKRCKTLLKVWYWIEKQEIISPINDKTQQMKT